MVLNLGEIEKALADGTPTPWSEKAIYLLMRHGRKDAGGWDDEIKDDEFMPDEDDAHLIANAPEWLRLLVEQNKSVLSRNEELQRENEKMKEVVDAAREHHKYENRAQGAFQWVCECPICRAVTALDAKEQDDD